MSHLQSDSVDKLFPALLEVQRKLTGVQTDAVNDHFKNKYPTLESVMATIRPALSENDLFISQLPNGESLVTIVAHVCGQWIGCETQLLNRKGDAQGMGSAITYARRYAAMSILGLSPEDDDGNDAVRPRAKTEHEIAQDYVSECLRSKCGKPTVVEANAIVRLVSGDEHSTYEDAVADLEDAKTTFTRLQQAGREYGWDRLKAMAMEEANATVS